MNKTTSPTQHNKEARQAHRRDLIWQIIVPMGIVAVIFIVISVLTAMRPETTASLWADISLIWLLIPWLIIALFTLVILGGLIYGMAKLLQIIPTYTKKLLDVIHFIQEKLKLAADASTKPVFFLEGIAASFRNIFQKK